MYVSKKEYEKKISFFVFPETFPSEKLDCSRVLSVSINMLICAAI